MTISTDKLKKYFLSRGKWEIGLLAVCMGFYLFFPFYDGAVWCKDSQSYATMNITREPLYPVFLWVFRRLFGEEGYLMPVVIVQSLLAAYAAWKLAVSVKAYKNNSRLLACLAAGFQFGVTILCRFVAVRGSSYTNSIMTEGLGLSLYVLFIVQLFLYILEEKKKNLAGMAVYALLLVNLRKQMLITLCLMAAMFVLYYLIKEQRLKKLLLLLLLTAGVLAAGKGMDRFYNYCVRGVWMEHSGNSMGILCTLVYTAGEEDAALFREEVSRGLFEEILRQAKEQGLSVEFAPGDFMGLSSHYADSYDAIGYGIINPVVQGYIAEHYDYTETAAAQAYDAYCGNMTKTLLLQDKGDLLRVYAANTWKGFINSIARVNRYLNIYAVFAYLLFIALYILTVKTVKKRKSRTAPDAALLFAETVLGGVIINSVVVGAMIFCQPRYMIYNMGLFYTALAVLLYDFLPEKFRV